MSDVCCRRVMGVLQKRRGKRTKNTKIQTDRQTEQYRASSRVCSSCNGKRRILKCTRKARPDNAEQGKALP